MRRQGSLETAVKRKRYARLLRSLAFGALLFERCTDVMVEIDLAGKIADNDEARRAFLSLFPIYFSGTHASVEQRLGVIKSLLLSPDVRKRNLGAAALQALLETIHFGGGWDFEFGGRSRDYGYAPRSPEDAKKWFREGLKLAGDFGSSKEAAAPLVRDVLARQFRGLWSRAAMFDELEEVCRAVAGAVFWKEGWIAVRQTIHFDSKDFPPASSTRLASLEELLRPKDLLQRVRTIVLSDGLHIAGLDATDDQSSELPYYRVEDAAASLGREVAAQETALVELLTELVAGHEQTWNFGRGLAEGCASPEILWERMASAYASRPEGRDVRVLHGFLHGLNAKNAELTSRLLDEALTDERLACVYPVLQTAVTLDHKSVDRLVRSLKIGKAPIQNYRNLVSGGITHTLPGSDFNRLLLRIAAEAGGFEIAIDILCMRISYAADKSSFAELVYAGCKLMSGHTFAGKNAENSIDEYRLGIVARRCLVGDQGAGAVGDICRNLKNAIANAETYAFYHADLLQIVFSAQPIAALDALCGGDEETLEKASGF